MNEIKRDLYLNKLIERKENGSIKVITGIRRCGKSYLLFKLYRDYLIQNGVDESRILAVALDSEEYEALRDHRKLGAYIKERIKDDGIYYVLLDEVQLCDGFEAVLNGLSRNPSLDIYATGSNSRFLSSDILTEFRGRGDEVRVFPLSFSEYLPAHQGDKYDAWLDYHTYGGLPLILTRKTDELKSKYLTDLFEKTYMADILERNHLHGDHVMDALIDMLASAVGSLTNPTRLANAFQSNGIDTSDKTVSAYIGHLQNAFMVSRARRYDIKGKKYIQTPSKYYFTDVGLRNARLSFRQTEENHIMENIIYNELRLRGFQVDVGVVEAYGRNDEGKTTRKQLEIDFVANHGSRKYYIQSAFSLAGPEKSAQEQSPLASISDSFKKIIVVRDDVKVRRSESGIATIGIWNFLLDNNSLDA